MGCLWSACLRPPAAPDVVLERTAARRGAPGPRPADRVPLVAGASPPPARARIRTDHLAWAAPAPVTPALLAARRDAFWDTAPTYGGRAEIWHALRAAVDAAAAGDAALVAAICDAAQVTLPPSGDLTVDGAYDVLGNRYIVPDYCLVDPANLRPPSPPLPASMSRDSQDTVDGPLAPQSPPADPRAGSPHPSAATALASPLIASAHGADEKRAASASPSSACAPVGPGTPLLPSSPVAVVPLSPRQSEAVPASPAAAAAAIIDSDQSGAPLSLRVRLSTGPTLGIPSARTSWTVAHLIRVLTSPGSGGPDTDAAVSGVRMVLHLGRVLPSDLRLGDIKWTGKDAVLLQVLVTQ